MFLKILRATNEVGGVPKRVATTIRSKFVERAKKVLIYPVPENDLPPQMGGFLGKLLADVPPAGIPELTQFPTS